jgi:hypothetical protein
MGRDLAPVAIVVILALAGFVGWRYAGWARGRTREPVRWRAAAHGLPSGGTAVVIECEGEPTDTVKVLPAGLAAEEFSDELARAMSEAQEKAAALNAARTWR